MNIDHRVREIFKSIFNIVNFDNIENLTMSQLENWDSINHLNLVVSLEEEFGLSFNENEIPVMDSFFKICDLINIKLK